MATTFHHVILGQPEIASMVFEFQFGVYEDVHPAFRACKQLIEFDGNGYYACDVSFPKAFAPHTVWRGRWALGPVEYCLENDGGDDRLPLHVAIYENLARLTSRIIRCRPDLASEDAIILAFTKNHLEIVELLLDTRESVPGLRQRKNHGTDVRNPRLYSSLLSRILEHTSTRGVELLRRFNPRLNDFSTSDAMRRVVQSATLPNLTLALDVLPWPYHPNLLNDVASKGFLSLVQSLHERGLECSTDAMDGAAANGHLEIVLFLHFNRTEGCTVQALDGAIRGGHLAIVQFLVEQGAEGAPRHILEQAAANGHLNVVEYLHSLGWFDCTVTAVNQAAAGGHLDVVKFLLAHRSDDGSNEGVVYYAVRNGHLRTVEYLLSLGYPFQTPYVCLDCEAFRKPEIFGLLELLLAHNTPFDPEWIVLACATRNVALLRFVYKYPGASCLPYAIWQTIEDEAWDVLDFLLANCPVDVSTRDLRAALRHGKIDVVSRMLQRQPELRHDDLLNDAIENRAIEIIRYLLTAGIGKPRASLVKIAGRRRHWTASKLLLPYCMDATNPLDNVIFLLKLYEQSDDRVQTLQVISQELPYQARKAATSVPLESSVAARATSLLQTGEVVDGALALVISHLYATNADVTSARLTRLVDLVIDGELKTQLNRLITRKRKRCGGTA